MKPFRIAYIATLILFCPPLAQANVGLPIISLGEPLMLLMFLPVFLIETIVYWKKLGKDLKSSALTSLWANLFTTLLGYPLSWILLLFYELSMSLLFIGIGFALSGLGVDLDQLASIPAPDFIDIFLIMLFSPAWLLPIHDIPVGLTACLLLMIGLIPAYYISISEEYRIAQKIWGDDPRIKEACITANKITYSILYLVVIGLFFYHYFQM